MGLRGVGVHVALAVCSRVGLSRFVLDDSAVRKRSPSGSVVLRSAILVLVFG